MKFYWVMGGSAVGKKTFIRRALAGQVWSLNLPERVCGAWFADGEISAAELLAQCEGFDAALVRWQWGRDTLLAELAEHAHVLLLLETVSEIQAQRVVRREGYPKWHAGALRDEARQVELRARELAAIYGLPLVRIDATTYRYTIK